MQFNIKHIHFRLNNQNRVLIDLTKALLLTRAWSKIKLQRFKSSVSTLWRHHFHIVTSPKQYVTSRPQATRCCNVTYCRLTLIQGRLVVETWPLLLKNKHNLVPILKFPTKPYNIYTKYLFQLVQNITENLLNKFNIHIQLLIMTFTTFSMLCYNETYHFDSYTITFAHKHIYSI